MYNAEKFIAYAIESVLSQTFQDFEIIIVDNCSTDNSFSIIQNYTTDDRVKLFQNQENIGMIRNWNQCILYATGKYLKFLFADDYFKNNALEEFITPFQKDPSISLVVSTREYLFDNGSTIQYPIYFKGVRNGKQVIDECISENFNPLGEPSFVMFRKQDITIGLFNTDMHWIADIDYWLRLCSIGNVFSLEKSCVLFRKHSQQATESIITNGKFLSEERNLIYYNFFIRRSGKQDSKEDYINGIWNNIRCHLYNTSYKDQQDYFKIWPATKSLNFQFYLFLHRIYRSLKKRSK
jgi:glycosyltransferase involved in cell wall biosynthesis